MTEVPYCTNWSEHEEVLYVTFTNGWRLELHGHYDDGVQVIVSVPYEELVEWEESEQLGEWYPGADYIGVKWCLQGALGEVDGLDGLADEADWPVSEIVAPVSGHATGEEPRCVHR